MAYKRNENTGSLFKVDEEKRTNEKYPQYTGECLINGVRMNVAGWVNVSDKGTQYMSLSFQEKQETQEGKNHSSGGYTASSTGDFPL